MINLPPIIARIRALLNDDSEQSVTYAALEARLALEKVCYDRLRQRHDYISHSQLRRWQPGPVINILIAEVDSHLSETMTLFISQEPTVPGVKPKDEDFVPVGTEIGFDPKRIAKMWNALAKLALHAHLPEHRNDHIPDYGDKAEIRAKVEEVVVELERLAKGTMTFSGLGEEVFFVCECGEKNRRRAGLLRDGQHIRCINPQCKYTWKICKRGGEFIFEAVTISISCENCKEINYLPWRYFAEMEHDQLASFSCNTCQNKNYVQWRLTQVTPRADSKS